MKIVVYKSDNPLSTQPYWFTIWRGSNRLAHSENYARKADAIKAILSIMSNAGTAEFADLTGEAR